MASQALLTVRPPGTSGPESAFLKINFYFFLICGIIYPQNHKYTITQVSACAFCKQGGARGPSLHSLMLETVQPQQLSYLLAVVAWSMVPLVSPS